MVFIETPTFTKRVLQLMEDEDYSALQVQLAKHPEAGKLIPGSGGMRKIRWAERTWKTRRLAGDILLVGRERLHFDAARLSEERAG